MAKRLEIIGLFNNSQIRRAFGDMIADTSKAKNTWSELATKMKATENEIKVAIKANVREIKEKTKAIDDLQRKMANPYNASMRSSMQQEVDALDKKIGRLKNINRELEITARTERMTSMRQFGGQVGSAAKTVGLGLPGVGAAVGVSGYMALQSYMPVDKQLALLDATLRPETQVSKDTVRNQVFGASTTYGKDAAEVASAYTQLFSSGLKPTAKEGTEEYTKQLEEAGQILGEVAKASAATGENMTSMQSALVYTANSFGKNLHSVKDVKEVLDAMGVTLDLGIGTMSQYTAEFSKFSPAAKTAGASMKESMAVFALMTQSYGPGEAGHATKQFFEESANASRYMSRAQNVLKRMDKNDMLVGTASDQAILGKFADKSTGAKALQSYFVDAKGNNKPLVETLKEVNGTYKKLNSDAAKNAFISAIGAMNANMIKTWRVMTGSAGYTDENGNYIQATGVDKLSNFISQYEQTGVMDAKIAQVNAHMAQKMAILGESWKNGMYNFINEAEPAITATIDFLTKAAGLLGPIGERIQSALGGMTTTERTAADKAMADQLKNLDISGNLPVLATGGFTPGDLRDKLLPLAAPASGVDISDIANRITSGNNVSKDEFIKAFGKNTARAAGIVSSEALQGDGAMSWAVGGISRLLGRGGLDAADFSAQMQNFQTILEKRDALTNAEEQKHQSELQGKMLQQLEIIANKDIGGTTLSGIWSSITSSGGAGTKQGAVPFVTNPRKSSRVH